jgi:DNA repair protein RadD
MSFELRPYQRAAVDAVWEHLRTRDDNPCVVIPTGGGKSHVISEVCREAVENWRGRVLVLTHVKELVEQNAEKLVALLGPDVVGIYSAGLGRRDTDHPVIAAGIQSVYRRAEELGPFDLCIVDEAHLLPPDGEGMYRTFLADAKAISPHLRVIGLTATPYRMTTGEICGPDNILNAVCYEAGVRDLIVQGYLCPLVSKAGREKIDTSSLHIRGGEFIAGEAEELMDTDSRVRAAVREIVERTADRNACLIFAAGVKHGEHIVRVFREHHGIECGFVTGNTSIAQRDHAIARFRGDSELSFEEKQQSLFSTGNSTRPTGPLKYLCNINVLTVGFDAPHIDCIAMLRPTASPGFYIQMTGRGFRPHPSKKDCLVLDFAGNVLRHGPVDAISVGDRLKGGGGEAPVKECPACAALIHAGYATCPQCGNVFPKPEAKHEAQASDAAILSSDVQPVDEERTVTEVRYSIHHKRGAPEDHPRTLRAEYILGSFYQDRVSEFLCPEHPGWARSKFERWWKERTDLPFPKSARSALEVAEAGGLAEPKRITVRTTPLEDYPRVINCQLGPKPDPEDTLERMAIRQEATGDEDEWGEPVGMGADDDFGDIPF